MPISTAEKSTLQDEAHALASTISALVVDADVNPLQAQVDALTAQAASLTADRDKARADLTAMGQARDELATKITAARQALA